MTITDVLFKKYYRFHIQRERALSEPTLQLLTNTKKCATEDAAAAVVTISTCIETECLNYRVK